MLSGYSGMIAHLLFFSESRYLRGVIVLFSGILCIILLAFKIINNALEKHIRKRVESVEYKSYKLIRSDQLWNIFHKLVKIIRFLIIFILSAALILYLLDLFPWTKGIRVFITDIFINPSAHFRYRDISISYPHWLFLLLYF